VDWAPLLLSLKVASLATALALLVGVPVAALLAWPRLWARDLIDAVVTSPMVLPPTAVGYYLLMALGRDSAIGRAWQDLFGTSIVFTLTGAVIACAVGSLPFVVKGTRTAIEDVDPTLQQAARTLGAGPLRVFFTITLPLASRGVFAGAILGFARSLGEFGILLMVIGSRIEGTQPMSMRIYDLFSAGKDEDAHRMALVTVVVGMSLLFFANRLTRKRPRG
jgi:molybdate transport system permease protein